VASAHESSSLTVRYLPSIRQYPDTARILRLERSEGVLLRLDCCTSVWAEPVHHSPPAASRRAFQVATAEPKVTLCKSCLAGSIDRLSSGFEPAIERREQADVGLGLIGKLVDILDLELSQFRVLFIRCRFASLTCAVKKLEASWLVCSRFRKSSSINIEVISAHTCCAPERSRE